MKKGTYSRVKRFLTSEAGQVGVRAPLTLGIVGGAFLLSQAEYITANGSSGTCLSNADCDPGEKCQDLCEIRINGTCYEWISVCL